MLPQNSPTIKFTEAGYQKIVADLAELRERRKSAVISLRTAREMGDLSENGAYKAARFQLNDIDREIRRLAYMVKFGHVAQINKNGTASFGCTVTVTDGKQELKFLLVSGYESNPKEHKLSTHSPIGKSLLGKRVGDVIRVLAPAGEITYTILRIE